MKRWKPGGCAAAAPATVAAMGLGGTILLCDRVYQAQGGKFVIAGTFTTLDVTVPDLRSAEHRIEGLECYVRLRPEKLGALPVDVLLRDEQRPPWEAPLMRLHWDLQVDERNTRLIEFPLTLPPFQLKLAGGTDAPTTGTLMLRYTIELHAEGEVVATTPFDVRFVARPPAP